MFKLEFTELDMVFLNAAIQELPEKVRINLVNKINRQIIEAKELPEPNPDKENSQN